MKKVFLLILSLAFIASCVKILHPENEVILKIPSGFDWKTIKELKLNVEVSAIDAQSSDKVHIIHIYNSALLNSGSLIATGAAKPNAAYIVTLSVATPTASLYIHETKPNGLVKVTQVEINSSTLNVRLDNQPESYSFLTKSGAFFGNNASFTSPSITIPAVYDFTITNNSALQLLGFAAGESINGNTHKSYFIPSGTTRTANIDFSNWRLHSILYVQGTLNMPGQIVLQNSSIVILNGGSVTSGGVNTTIFNTTNVPIIYIQNGGTLSSTDNIRLEKAVNYVNKGQITLTGNDKMINMNTGSILYNEGKIEVTNSNSYFHVTNTSQVYNSGTVKSPSIDMTTNATFLNDLSAIVEAGTWYQTNGTILNNHGEVVATTKFSNSGGGTVNNFCRITAAATDIQSLTANLETGSLWNSQTFIANNSTMNMSGASMFITANTTSIYKLNVISSAVPFALFKNTGNMPDLRWAQTQFSGNIEYSQPNLTEGTGTNGRGLYESSFSNGAILTNSQTKNIPGTACNLSLGVTEPGGGDPPAPLFGVFFPSETGWGTYAFEDQWPKKGDYDINDIVLAFRVGFYSNTSNQIVELHFKYKILAVGAIYNIAPAFQLDNLPASNIQSVTGQIIGGSTPFQIQSNGAEDGVVKAVIPIFNNTKNVVSYSGFLNTERGSYTPTEEKEVIVKFNTPVNQSLLTMDSFNFFISVIQRGREIHLPSYEATTKFDNSLLSGTTLDPDDRFKFIDGMMWGLMFPVNFEYPVELASIINAYTHFGAWATSGGAQYPYWYTDVDGYKNFELIY